MIYDKGKESLQNWIIEEDTFNSETLKKCESIFCQGNGYLGLRAATEEEYENMNRSLLVAGTFDKIPTDATELPNTADITAMDMTINGLDLNLTKGVHTNYSRTINLKNGLLSRSFLWTSEKDDQIAFESERVVSLKDRHLIALKIKITPQNNDISLSLRTGIDADRIHPPVHFSLVNKEEKNGILNLTTQTNQSGILFSSSAVQIAKIDGSSDGTQTSYSLEDGMKIYAEVQAKIPAGKTFEITKIANIFTSRDQGNQEISEKEIAEMSQKHLELKKSLSFEEILKESEKEWAEKIWGQKDIIIKSTRQTDQLAIRFAIYHLTVMTPSHDNRMNIGAKGFSGPGYKGHSFWDTEIFMLPYFIFSSPKEARSLLEHRYNSLQAAQKNAAQRGYAGAMYPWESAWITDGEVTPEWCLTGLMEHHITADVAFGVYYYYTMTGDLDFMEKYGYKIIFETAKFWISRLEYNKTLDRYEINHVIGPDEYKEDVNNNAYTNYMANLNIQLAVQYAESLRTNKPYAFDDFNSDGSLDMILGEGQKKAAKLYLPKENEDGLVPEDDTFLSLPDICIPECSLSEMIDKARELAGKIGYLKTQISKQADVMVLFFLMEDLFSPEIKKKNFYYYEKRCFHDSSLSLSTHSILANDLGEKEQAYKLYSRAAMIDLGENMKSSDAGIHAASLGGIWQCTVLGFGGVRLYGQDLRIQPNLPENWSELQTPIYWKGQKMILTVTHNKISLTNQTKTGPVTILVNGTRHTFTEQITLPYQEEQVK